MVHGLSLLVWRSCLSLRVLPSSTICFCFRVLPRYTSRLIWHFQLSMQTKHADPREVQYAIYYRGLRSKTVKVSGWRTLWRTKKVKIPVYQRLVMMFRLTPRPPAEGLVEKIQHKLNEPLAPADHNPVRAAAYEASPNIWPAWKISMLLHAFNHVLILSITTDYGSTGPAGRTAL